MARLRFGAVLPTQQSTAEALAAACQSAGTRWEVPTFAARGKFVFLASCGVEITAWHITIRSGFAQHVRAAMKEVGSRPGAQRTPAETSSPEMIFLDSLPHEMTSSMHKDLVAGNRLEVPWLSGAVARMAKESGVAAPIHATIHAALKSHCAGAAH
jgi:2-dehydropantoate 2-reductase